MVAFSTDGGKSTIIDGLQQAFGKNTFTAILAKSATGTQARFSPLPYYLTSRLGVFVIELHEREIGAADMNAWTERMPEYERKFSNIEQAPRIGTVMILGDEEPINFSSDNQGFKTRIKWVSNQLDTDAMAENDYHSFVRIGGIYCMINEFIERAYQRFQVEDKHWVIRKKQQEEQYEDVQWLYNQSRDPVVLAIMELFEEGLSLDFLPTAQIVAVLKEYAKENEDSGIDLKKIPTTRQINKQFKQAFGKKHKSIAKNISGKTTRGYPEFTLSDTGKQYLPAEKKRAKR